MTLPPVLLFLKLSPSQPTCLSAETHLRLISSKYFVSNCIPVERLSPSLILISICVHCVSSFSLELLSRTALSSQNWD